VCVAAVEYVGVLGCCGLVHVCDNVPSIQYFVYMAVYDLLPFCDIFYMTSNFISLNVYIIGLQLSIEKYEYSLSR
jgi:hypothetical protein